MSMRFLSPTEVLLKQMSSFDLIPVHGGDPIHLPPGETVLGRGPLLGVSDKRVSRHHGLLDNNNGQLRLKPTHLNPCFLQSSLTDDPQPLQKDVWCPLDHGDVFSLLPGQLLYRVVSLGGKDSPLRGSAMLEQDPLPVSPQATSLLPLGAERDAPMEDTSFARDGTYKSGKVSPKEEVEVASPSPRVKKRVLPSWMMAVAAASASCSPQAAKKKRQIATKKATPTSSLPEEAELSEDEEKPKVKRRRKDTGQTAGLKTDVPSSHRSRVSSQKDANSLATETQREDVVDRDAARRAHDVGQSQSKETNGSKDKEKKESASRLRSPCPYGKDCYRKNPLHFRESSHPGDSDYEEEEEEQQEEEGRPECPYGTDCYRKNPLHRKEYKHTKRAARSTRAPPKRPSANDEHEDSEDSFINNDSEDAGDDSDYVPAESDDDGGEDVTRLQREAAAFVSGRK
ncbi:aprataxin and PNK-like factor isoform X2 [Dunckerocampus dactyliophorus]|uniref:aprataxin and PNK-like factor isoform X2 n=1 Tax=Dunckerocampus dactyliophorus TaxID=161453 RepID=UPI002406D42A|nr:aprataxin and PNK-like factor isoform X2 [Dunckerocampus dactyliophorus]